VEPLNRATSRPYTVMGKNFTPMTALAPYRERGAATWYGRRYHGKQTSSGEPYDMYAMTAAHTILPIPSYARVTNLDNGRSVVVRINDRGPFVGERLIDLSYVAAHKLDIVRSGSAQVEVETVLTASDGAPQATQQPARRPHCRRRLRRYRPQALDSQQPTPLVADSAGLYLQLAAFSLKENAERFAERASTQLDGYGPQLRIVSSGSMYRIHVGPYADRGTAEQAAARITALLGATPIITAPR
jgi:rare lipoprotein A